MDDRLSLSITHADGTVTRWGGDEPNARDIPRGLKFGTSMPGGFKDLTCSLPRRVDVDYPDLVLFDDVRAYGPGDETAWEGRQQQFPRQQATDFSIDVGAVGQSAQLTDLNGFREIYVDRDPSRWTEEPIDRKAALAGSIDIGTITASVQSNGISFAVPGGAAIPTNSTKEVWYNAGGGLAVAKFGYQAKEAGDLTNFETRKVYHAASPVAAFTGTALTVDDTARMLSLTAEQWLMVRLSIGTGRTQPAGGSTLIFSKIAAYGNHGLTTHAVTGDLDGIYASDAIANILSRTTGLNFTTGANGSIQPTTFAIAHLAFYDPTTASDAVQLINGYHLYNWAVWDRKTFYFRPPDSTLDTVWEARISDGAQIQLEGDQGADIFNGVIVSYTDPLGAAKTVGPPGSTTDAQDSSLQSTDPLNPVNARGLTKWETISVSVPTTQAGATQLGFVWLVEHTLPQKRGQIVLTGTATCVQSGWRNARLGARPAWAPRAGDWVRIADDPSDEPRRIIETAYDHDARAITLTVGTTPFKLDAIIERLTAQAVGAL